MENFGWPCYEGVGVQPAYRAATLNICRDLYAQPAAVTPPVFAYKHGVPVVQGESLRCWGFVDQWCRVWAVGGWSYPAEYAGALFFADYPRHCIWAMLRGRDGNPDPSRIRTVVDGGVNPVDLQIGPGWGSVLRGHLRQRPPDPVLPGESAAGRGGDGVPVERPGAVDGVLRRARLA